MHFDLLIKSLLKGYSLNDFTSDLLTFSKSEQWEFKNEGEKGHFYFRMVVLGVVINVMTVKDDRFKGYEFGIRFESEIIVRGERLSFDGLADCLARKLAVNGYDVVRIHYGEHGYDAVRYVQNTDRDSKIWKPVLTEEADCKTAMLPHMF